MFNSFGYNQTAYNGTGSITKVKTVTAKARILSGTGKWTVSVANIKATTTRTVTSKARILRVGETKTCTSKANISVMVHCTALARIKRIGETKTVTTKATLLDIVQGMQPRLSSTSSPLTNLILPFPHKASMQLVEVDATVDTLAYRTDKDLRSYKYQYNFKWDVMSVQKYDVLEEIINLDEPLLFVYTKWPQSESAVTVLAELGTRGLVAGTGSMYFWSSVELTLIEVDPR